jgi:hypothetical protein
MILTRRFPISAVLLCVALGGCAVNPVTGDGIAAAGVTIVGA